MLNDRSPRSARRATRRAARLAALACAAALAAAACNGNDSQGGGFAPLAAQGHVARSGPVALAGNWLVYLEEEASPAGPVDLNGNMAMGDRVAVAVSMGGASVFPLGVAAVNAHVVGNEIYLEASEAADGRDWNGDGMMNDLVLLHWSFPPAGVANGTGLCNAEGVCFVDELEPVAGLPSALAVPERLFYTAAAQDLAMQPDGATSLRWLEPAAPLMPQVVMHPDLGQRRPRLLGAREGLVLLGLDESVEGQDLNGDTDDFDVAVLALLDAISPVRGLRSTELALPSTDSPVVARRNDAFTDWLVAFLVSEADQGGMSRNDRDAAEFAMTGWEPVQCAAAADTDALDVVLAFLHFEPWFADPVASPPRNTGLVGRDPLTGEPDRVLVVEGFVAVVSDEASAGCDLNADMDTDDSIARWVDAVADPMMPILPPGDVTQLHALATALPGGSQGLAALQGRFVSVVDEAADSDDVDSDSAMNDLVAHLDPTAGALATWSFLVTTGSTNPSVGAGWMAAEPTEQRLGIGFQESVQGLSLNSACRDLSFADPDAQDELPVWLRFSGSLLLAPGVGFAAAQGSTGLVVARGLAYFRVDEALHGVDVDGDGAADDLVLVRNPIFACEPGALFRVVPDGTPDGSAPVIFTDGLVGAAFVASETDAGQDLNGNGFVGEDVLLYFGI